LFSSEASCACEWYILQFVNGTVAIDGCVMSIVITRHVSYLAVTFTLTIIY